MGRLLTVFLWPLAEIAGFIVAGHIIGLGGVLLAVILGVVAGFSVLRRAGWRALDALRRGTVGGDPEALRAAAEDAWLALAGALLIIPGFISDAVALGLLMPAVRSWLVRHGRQPIVMGSVHVGGFAAPGTAGGAAPIIDGEFHEIAPRGIDGGKGPNSPR